jgi:polar amino acid transport system permease protein
MTFSPALDRPKGKAYFLFWRTVFVLLLAASVLILWGASATVEYTWRWNRVPQYFWYTETIEIHAGLEGEVRAIDQHPDGATVVVVGPDGEERHHVPQDSLKVRRGDMVFPGDTVAAFSRGKPGLLLEGLWITLKVSILAIIAGIILGILTGLARISINPALRWGAITYIEIIRGSPLLVQIFLWYFVVGTVANQLLATWGGAPIDPMWYGVLALAVFTGAYVAEIVRAGIQSVHRGQMEAARSLGLTYRQAMARIILPQALRRILPPLAGQFISLIKDSSLLGVISIRELTKASREVVSSSLQPFEVWIVCAILYLVLTFTLSLFVQYLERKAI